jgi:hypothetical protein
MDQRNNIDKRLSGLSSLIGNTPLLEIELKYKGDEKCSFTENGNIKTLIY